MDVDNVFTFNKVPKFLNELSKIPRSYVTVGIHADAKDYPNGTPVVLVASVNEFGLLSLRLRIPGRSFLRSTHDENLEKETNFLKEELPKVALGNTTVQKILERVGFRMREKTKAKIEQIKTPPNAEYTIENKGFDNPLIDTRHLKNSIAYKVTIK